ncbi:unnamed protein product [Effrenium voratum]|nr:unnamed protein product [Effrenium voratum]
MGRQHLAKVQLFQEWFLKKHSLDLQEFGIELRADEHGGTGVYARHRLQPGEVLAQIPTSALLYSARARQALPASCATLPLTEEEFLWLYMIWGREDPQYEWHPYLQLLPAQDPLRWLWDPCAQRWLAGTPIDAKEVLAEQRRRHEEVSRLLGDQAVSWEQWLWARGCYLSRSFDQAAFPRSDSWGSAAMCPLLDSMNHSAHAEVEARYDIDFAGLWLPDTGSYEAGEEVFHLYKGNADNATLLQNYGFSLMDNPFDCVEELELPEAKLQLAEALTMDTQEAPEELLMLCAEAKGRQYQADEASCRHKAKVCKWALKPLRQMLSRMQEFPAGCAVLLNLRGTLGRFAGREAKRRAKARRPKAAALLLPFSGPARDAAIFALGRFRILRRAAAAVQESAEMAILAARMEQRQAQTAE